MSRRALDEFFERVRNRPRRAQLDAAAVEVIDAFRAAGLKPLLLKGAALAQTLYGPEEYRGYGDVDLLVARQALAASRQALTAIGYTNAEPPGIDDVAGILYSETWVRVPEGSTGRPLMVDLHWRLAGCEAPADVTWRVMWTRRAWIEIDGHRVAVPARDGLALHVATHAAQHGPENGKVLADLARGIERWNGEVWRSAARLAEQLDGTPAFAAGLRLLPAGAELARTLGLPPTDTLEWAIRNRNARPRGTFHLTALARARGVRAEVDVLRRALLPTREWISVEFPWANAGRARLVAAYGAHLVRAPMWAARAWRYRRWERRAER